MQAYSDPSRETDPHALPNVEIFHVSKRELGEYGDIDTPGWYWHACFPGCLPDGEPQGPFGSEREAIEDCLLDPLCEDIDQFSAA